VLIAVGLIGVSPVALGLFHGATSQWERLSFIGQTYGAASAVVAVLALAGVVVTLGYQARETRRAREETRRNTTADLLRMAMTDPDLDKCWGPVPLRDDPTTRKQQLYTNMIIAAWELSWEMGATPEHRLRVNANEMFRGQIGRDFWRNAGARRLAGSANRRERRFHEILDEEYRRALADHPHSELRPDPRTPQREPGRMWSGVRKRLVWAGIGAGVVAAFYRVLRRR